MFPPPVERLIKELRKLPGVGEKTAARYAFHILRSPPEYARSLAETLVEVKNRIRECPVCFQLSELEPCEICASQKRNHEIVCVVENQAGLMAVEKSHCFFGRYHILGGKLSPMDGQGPEKLKLRELIDRVKAGGIKEVIIATNPDVEGEATAVLLKKQLSPFGIKITRIAQGIPVGGDLEYSDPLTLTRAMKGRTDF